MLPDFFDVFVAAYLSHGETYTDGDVSGAALWAAPETDPLSADPAYAERLHAIAGVDAPRLFEIVELLEAVRGRSATTTCSSWGEAGRGLAQARAAVSE